MICHSILCLPSFSAARTAPLPAATRRMPVTKNSRVRMRMVTQAGIMTLDLFWLSLLATAVALAAFGLGLLVQDRMNQRVFNRVILGVLTALGGLLVFRAMR